MAKKFQVWLKSGVVSAGTVSIPEINSNAVPNAELHNTAARIVKNKIGQFTKNYMERRLKLNVKNLVNCFHKTYAAKKIKNFKNLF